MADEFDAFSNDFEMTDDIEAQDDDLQSISEGKKEKNPLKLIINFFKSVNKKILIAIGVVILIIIATPIVIAVVNQPSILEEEIKNPYYYALPEYKFKLDDMVNGKIPYIRLRLELVFDKKYKGYEKEFEKAKYQIADRIKKDFIEKVDYREDIENGNVQGRQRIYEESLAYINRLLDRAVVKDIMEVKFEYYLMQPRY